MSAQFECPHCHNPIKAIPLASRGAGVLFQSTAPAGIEEPEGPPARFRNKRGFWASLTGTYTAAGVMAGGIVWLYGWWAGYDPVWAVLVALAALFGLPVLELFLHRPPRRKRPRAQRTDIRVVMQSEDRRETYLDHFQDQTIQPEKIGELARLVLASDFQWQGRPTVCRQTSLSQTDYAKIAQEFTYQGYLLDGNGNNRMLSFRGRAFLREMAGRLPARPGR